MPKKIFISYSHKQSDWVKTCLVPCLEAGGASILVDYREFRAGKRVIGQMDIVQDKADATLLLISPDYLSSKYCEHEMDRAVQRDPQFENGIILPVIKESCELQDWLKPLHELIWVDLKDDKDNKPWDLLLNFCDANLGISAPDWLTARDEICRYLARNESVNLVVYGRKVKWKELLKHIRTDCFKDIGTVDLQRGAAVSRRGLVEEILKACGEFINVPSEPEDLVILDKALCSRPLSRLIFSHFDIVRERKHYEIDLFSSLRHLIMESKKLVLVIQSRQPFASLLPSNHPLSSITSLKAVELRGTQ